MSSSTTLATLDFQPVTCDGGEALDALCFRLRDDHGDYWQAVRLWRVREVKKFFKQIASLEELSDDFVSALYDPAGQRNVNALFSLSNVLVPRLGIFQLFGVRGFGETMEEALERTAASAAGMRTTFEGKFRQSIVEPMSTSDAVAWYCHLTRCSHVGVMLGHPVPRKMSTGGDLDGGLNRLSSLEAAEQMEVVAAACAEIPYTLNFFVDPLNFGEINAMLRDTLRELGKMRTESAATQSASVSMVLPALAVPQMSYQQATTRETMSGQDAARQHADTLADLTRFNTSAAHTDTSAHTTQAQVYRADEHYTDAEHRVTNQQGNEHVTEQARQHVATDQVSREDWMLHKQYAGTEQGVIADSKVTKTDTVGARVSDAHIAENTQSFEHRQVATSSVGHDAIAQSDLYKQAEQGVKASQYTTGEAGARQTNFNEAGSKATQYTFAEQGFKNTQYTGAEAGSHNTQYTFGESGFKNTQYTGAEAGSHNTQFNFAEGGTQSGAGSSHQTTVFNTQQSTLGASSEAGHSSAQSGYSDASQRQVTLDQNGSANTHSQANTQTGTQTAQGAIAGEAGFGVKGANISGQVGIPGVASVNVGASGGPHGDLSVSGSLTAQQQNQQQGRDTAESTSVHSQVDSATALQGVKTDQTARSADSAYADSHAQSGVQSQNTTSGFNNSYANAGSGSRNENYQNAFAGSLNQNYQTGGAGWRNENYQNAFQGWLNQNYQTAGQGVRNENYQLAGQRNEQYAQAAQGFRNEAFQSAVSGARNDAIDRSYASQRFDDIGVASSISSNTHRVTGEQYADSNIKAEQSLEQYSKAFAGDYVEAGSRLAHLQTDALIQSQAERAAQFQRSVAQSTSGEGVTGRDGAQQSQTEQTAAQGQTQSAASREMVQGPAQSATDTTRASILQGTNRVIASGFSSGGSPSLVAGMGLSRVTYDEQKAAIARLLAAMADRLQRGQTGGMYQAHVYLGAESEGDLDALGRALVAALREDEVVQPVQIRGFDPATTSRLHRHQLALTPWRLPDPVNPLEIDALGTIMTADELGALVHPLRIDGTGGISTTVEALPSGLATPANLRGEMWWGNVVSPTNGRKTGTHFRVDRDSLMHLTLVGGSGSGKSNSAMHILGEVFNIREDASGRRIAVPTVQMGQMPIPHPQGSTAGRAAIGATVFDPTGEWRRMGRVIANPDEFRFYSLTNPNYHPLRFNPLSVPSPFITPAAWAEMVAKRWALAYATGSTGYYAIKSAILRLYQDRGVIDPQTGATNWQASAAISIADLYAMLDETRSRKASSRSKADISVGVMDRILEKMSDYLRDSGSSAYFMFGQAGGCLADDFMAEHVCTVLEGRFEDDGMKVFIIGLLGAAAFAHAAGRWEAHGRDTKKTPQHILVFEESHEVMEGDEHKSEAAGAVEKGTSLFNKMFDQGRKYGLYVWGIGQRLKALPEGLLSSSRILICQSIDEADDIKLAVVKMGFLSTGMVEDVMWMKFLQSLEQGRGVVRFTRMPPTDSGRKPDLMRPTLVQFPAVTVDVPSDAELEEILAKRVK